MSNRNSQSEKLEIPVLIKKKATSYCLHPSIKSTIEILHTHTQNEFIKFINIKYLIVLFFLKMQYSSI